MPSLPSKEKSRNILKRAGWLLLTLLFVVTGLGVGLVAFWQATHQPKDNTSQTTPPPPPPPSANALQGKPLANFTPVKSVDKLQTIDLKVGTGAEVKPNSKITANYTGAVAATGIVFQSSLDNGGKPFTTTLDQVIKGWQEGLPGMKAGGERRLLIPAAEAYGSNPPQGSGIPANADLVFDISLIAVQ
jgi:FKBP-type peptidyl-prolyl cis-trans isomerase FkpA